MIGQPVYEFKYLDEVSWFRLSGNPNAIHLLENNLDKLSWKWLSTNPNIFKIICEYDYEKMILNMKDFCEELVKYVFHPNRLQRLAEHYGMDMTDLLEVL